MLRVPTLHQFIVERLPEGIYGSDDDIDPACRGFTIMSREDLRALIDIGYAQVHIQTLLVWSQFCFFKFR